MKQFISRFHDMGYGWTAQVNLTFDNETLEVLNEEVVCSHKDVNYKTSNKGSFIDGGEENGNGNERSR